MSYELAASVAGRYPDVRIFRSRDELLTQFPLTPVEGTQNPRLSAPTRTLLRRALWTYAVVATLIGLVPSEYLTRSPAGATVLLAALALAFVLLAALALAFVLLVGGLLVRTPMIACVGSSAAAWLCTNDLHSVAGLAYQALVPAMVLWAVVVWRRAARPGAVVREDRALSAVLRWWFRRVDGR